MEIRDQEQRRADNLIWNAAGDYSLHPWFRIYDGDGRAELYWNSILGAVFRRYDGNALRAFTQGFGGGDDRLVYETVFWLGLENAVCPGELALRPGLGRLRAAYAETVQNARVIPDARLTALLRAYYGGPEDTLPPSERALLAGLRSIDGSTTEAVLAQLLQLMQNHFHYVPADPDDGRSLRGFFLQLLGKKDSMNHLAPVRGFAAGYVEQTPAEEAASDEELRRSLRLPRPTATRDIDMRSYVTGYFGPSVFHEREVLALERELCTGNHRECHLHFTRGAAGDTARVKGYAGERRAAALAQEAVNREAYEAEADRNRAAVARLTARIQNSLLTRLDTAPVRASAGRLEAGRVWRSTELRDGKVFTRPQRGEAGALTVDLLLDASTSQIHRQTSIAAQGYIIAESLTACRIPVRVYSFCSMNGFTILNLFRDYGETGCNRNVFRYFTAGCNRDGLAVRAAAAMLGRQNAEHRLLLVLSDCKPNDVMKVQTRSNEYREYIEDQGIEDTAAEVHQARVRGIRVMCVFTGTDDDLPAAKRIYGQHMTRIRSLDHFAEAVSSLLQGQIAEI